MDAAADGILTADRITDLIAEAARAQSIATYLGDLKWRAERLFVAAFHQAIDDGAADEILDSLRPQFHEAAEAIAAAKTWASTRRASPSTSSPDILPILEGLQRQSLIPARYVSVDPPEKLEALLSKAKESVLRALRPGTRPKRHLESRGRCIEALLELKLDIRVLIRIFRKVTEVSRRYAELDRTLLRIRGGAGLPRERLNREYERLRRITRSTPQELSGGSWRPWICWRSIIDGRRCWFAPTCGW